MSQIHVCFSINDDYAPYCGVAIQSMLMNAAPEDSLVIHILHKTLSAENIEKLRAVTSGHNRDIRFAQLKDSDFKGFPLPPYSHFTLETYFRIAISRLFPDTDRMIYLDCDILVLDSLSELYHTDMRGKPLAMIKDNHGTDYNGGVMLIDCAKWRRDATENMLCQYMHDHTIVHVDQELINKAMPGEILPLDGKWNVQLSVELFDEDGIAQAMQGRTIYILHMLGYLKPWHGVRNDRMTEMFFQYAKFVPWVLPDHRERNKNCSADAYFHYRRALYQFILTSDVLQQQNLLLLTQNETPDEMIFAASDLGCQNIKTGRFGDYDLIARDFSHAAVEAGNVLIANDIMKTYGYELNADYCLIPNFERRQVSAEALMDEYRAFSESFSSST